MMSFIGLVVLITLLQHSTTAQHIYCKNTHFTTNYTKGNVRFSEPYDKFGLPKEIQTCTDQRITLTCCMKDFTEILWYQQLLNNTWVAFLEAGENRKLDEHNQTAILMFPYINHDPGNYKCEGYGETGPAISQITKLQVHECVERQLPAPFYPPDSPIVLRRRRGEYLEIPCQGFYGDVSRCNVTVECDIGWYQQTSGHRRDINTDTTQRIYVSTAEKMLDYNGLICTLYISGVTEADYESQFICWMNNSVGKQDPARIVEFKPSESNVLRNPVFQALTGICGFLLLLTVILLVMWRCRLAIQRYIKDIRRKPLNTEDLKYDVLLMSGETSNRNSLSYYLCHKLRNNSPYRYSVYHFPEDVNTEHCLHDVFFEELKRSRCVVCVLSAELLRDEHCLFCLDAAIDDVTIVFVLQPGSNMTSLDDVAQMTQLTDKVKLALRLCRRKLVWPVVTSAFQCDDMDCDGGMAMWRQVEKVHGKEVEKFWNQLRLAIPNTRKSQQQTC